MFKNRLPVSLSIALALLAAVACSAEVDEGIENGGVDDDVDTLARRPKPPSGGTCTAATAATDCQDNNACTLDSCVANVCKNTPLNGNACDDGNSCTQGDTCSGGTSRKPSVCNGTPIANCATSIQPVDLGTAGNYVVLAKSGISTVPSSVITGDLGLSPAAATNATGFSLIMDSTGVFSTSTQVIGKVFAADYTPPTPSNLTTAIGDMELAFTDAAGRAPNFTEVGAGNIGGLTLPAGVYKWGTGVRIPTDVTLTGSATDVWVFQVAGTLVMSGSMNVTLAGAALPKNVFWQVSGLVDIGTEAHFEGVILTKTAITVKTGASVKGRLLAQTAVSLQKATITQPSP